MRRQDVIDNIEGSRLKRQFLEAFLLQSTFIESLLKRLVADDFFSSITLKVSLDEFKKGNFKESKQVKFVREKLLRQNLYEIIEYVYKMGLIDDDLRKNLHKYRDGRNDTLHDLVSKMTTSDFERELEELVRLGQLILNNPAIIKASESVQMSEELIGIVKNKDFKRFDEFMNRLQY